MKKTISIDQARLPSSLFEATQIHNHLLSMHLHTEKSVASEKRLILYTSLAFISSLFTIAFLNRSNPTFTFLIGISLSVGMILICISRQQIVNTELKRHNNLSNKGLLIEDRFKELSGIFNIYAKKTKNLTRSTFLVTCVMPILVFGVIGSTCLFLSIMSFSFLGANIASSFLFSSSLAYLVTRFRSFHDLESLKNSTI